MVKWHCAISLLSPRLQSSVDFEVCLLKSLPQLLSFRKCAVQDCLTCCVGRQLAGIYNEAYHFPG